MASSNVRIQNMSKNNNNNNNKNKNKNKKISIPNNNQLVKNQPGKLNLNVNNLSSDARKYKEGLLNPFSDSGTGSRLPDQYFAPTVTFAVREFLTLKADASGDLDVVLCPNPLFVAWSSRNSIANGSTMVMKDGTSFANAQYVNDSTSFSQKLSNYRVVNWGIRVRQTQSINTSQGTITAALVTPRDGLYHPSLGATSGSVGGQAATGANWATSTLGRYIISAGIPSTGFLSTSKIDVGSLVDFPYHMRASCVNAAENSYEIVPKLVSPTACHFRASSDNYFGTDIVGQTSLAFIQPGDASYILCDGWTNIVFAATGLVANSTGAVDLEIVYNIEGNPAINYAGTNTVAVATGMKSAHDPIGMLLAQAALDSAIPFKLVNIARAAFKSFGSI